jgi:hypothetical protein
MAMSIFGELPLPPLRPVLRGLMPSRSCARRTVVQLPHRDRMLVIGGEDNWSFNAFSPAPFGQVGESLRDA